MRAIKLFVFGAILFSFYFFIKNLIGVLNKNDQSNLFQSQYIIKEKITISNEKKITKLWIEEKNCIYTWQIEHFFDRGEKSDDLVFILNKDNRCFDFLNKEIHTALINKIHRLWDGKNIKYIIIKNYDSKVDNFEDILNSLLIPLNIRIKTQVKGSKNELKYQLEELGRSR